MSVHVSAAVSVHRAAVGRQLGRAHQIDKWPKMNGNGITPNEIRTIRDDGRRNGEIAHAYNVSRVIVWRIKRGLRHVKAGDNITPPAGFASLSEADVIAIRADLRAQTIIAAEYGVTPAYISKLKRGLKRASVAR